MEDAVIEKDKATRSLLLRSWWGRDAVRTRTPPPQFTEGVTAWPTGHRGSGQTASQEERARD